MTQYYYMPPVLRLKEFVLGAPAEETAPFESTAAPAMFEKPPQETSVTQWNYEFHITEHSSFFSCPAG